jgi:anaphase-promoting complex subunit 8
MSNTEIPSSINPVISQNPDPIETALEARETHKYLLAKSFFDCREFDRCAAVFLPSAIPLGLLPTNANVKPSVLATPQKGKGKGTANTSTHATTSKNPYPKLSQKSLFLALYAKYMAGEKRKNEESEMVLGPADGGMTVNRELPDLASGLEGWFAEREEKGLEEHGQGWLEYLYGIILAKGKIDKEAKRWLLKSAHRYPWNWGAWLELNDLIENFEELQSIAPQLPQNPMALMFYLHCSQENYQTGPETHRQFSALEDIFPTSSFLRTERALLLYHSKGPFLFPFSPPQP